MVGGSLNLCMIGEKHFLMSVSRPMDDVNEEKDVFQSLPKAFGGDNPEL
jgi:hypothetical protein